MELRGPGGVVARQELALTVLSANRPIELSLTLPEAAAMEYELVLDVAGERVTWPIVVPEQRVDAEFKCEQRLVRRGEVVKAAIHTGAIPLETGVAYGIARWAGAWRDIDPFEGEPGGWAAVALIIPTFTEWPVRVRVPERAEPGRHRLTKRVHAEDHGIGWVRLAAEFTVRDAPAVDYDSLLRTGAWRGIQPGADRASVRSRLGEPDERSDADRVWRYGDLDLHFEADTLRGFFGQVIPDRLLDDLAMHDHVGVWTQRLQSGAHLDIDRPHAGTYPRLRSFSITT
jgi:hypothetical protein